MEIAKYRDKIFSLYEQGRFREALEIAKDAQLNAPHFEAKTSFWIACLQGRLGQDDEAIETLGSAVSRGIWWSERTLMDPDLKSVRGRPGFQQIEKDCIRLKTEHAGRSKPELMVRSPSRTFAEKTPPALIVFHQSYGERPELSAEPWTSVLSTGTLLAAPWSSQVYSYDGRCWDDPAIAETDVRWTRSELSKHYRFDSERLVLGGFSQGGALAIYCVLKRVIPSRGFVAVAPSDWVRPDRPATERKQPSEAFRKFIESSDCHGLRGVIIIGDADAFYPKVEQLYQGMVEGGLDGKLIVEAGLGHSYPNDFPSKLETAIHFVLNHRLTGVA